jgi:hypothetical protein
VQIKGVRIMVDQVIETRCQIVRYTGRQIASTYSSLPIFLTSDQSDYIATVLEATGTVAFFRKDYRPTPVFPDVSAKTR